MCNVGKVRQGANSVHGDLLIYSSAERDVEAEIGVEPGSTVASTSGQNSMSPGHLSMGRQAPSVTAGGLMSGAAAIQSVRIQMRAFIQSTTIQFGTGDEFEASQDG